MKMKVWRILLLYWGGFVLSSTSPVFAANTCTVADIQGDTASVWRSGTVMSLSEAMTLVNDDRIETGARTTVSVLCSNEMRITIGPDTAIDLGTLVVEDESWSTFLMEGVAWFARPLFGKDRFEVRTPSAVASVRSTEWFVEVKEGATAVFVEEGGVSVAAGSGGALVNAGLGIDVRADGVAGPPKTWGAKRVIALRQRLGFLTE